MRYWFHHMRVKLISVLKDQITSLSFIQGNLNFCRRDDRHEKNGRKSFLLYLTASVWLVRPSEFVMHAHFSGCVIALTDVRNVHQVWPPFMLIKACCRSWDKGKEDYALLKLSYCVFFSGNIKSSLLRFPLFGLCDFSTIHLNSESKLNAAPWRRSAALWKQSGVTRLMRCPQRVKS